MIPSAPTGALPARIGRYRILSKLGEGGMGIVYEAEQQNPRRRVALKVVRGGRFVDDNILRLFRREAETLARLRHPNIGAIYESGHTDDGQHYFAMELVQGDTLDQFLARRPKASTPEEVRFRLALFKRIADAVHYAHQRAVIHRDLKPSNIVVARDADSDASVTTLAGVRLPDVKILDFGLARITEGDLHATQVTEVGVLKGTLPYMAPEQARGQTEAIDVRTDVYALGVILYEMLSGTKPYELTRGSLIEAVRVICEEPPRSLRTSMAGVRRIDPDIETMVGKALEKDADRRYASAAAMAEDVERYLSSQPILARPPSTMYQIQKFAARNRPLVAGVAATFLVLVAGVVASTTFAVRAMRAERLANERMARALWAEAQALADRREAEEARALSEVRRTEADAQRTVAEHERSVAAVQRRAAEESGALARREAAKAGAINRFLQDMLATADPWAGDAGKVTLDAALEQAQRRIGAWAGDDPDVDHAIRGAVATAFAGVGRYAEAESLLRGGLDRLAAMPEASPVLRAGLHRQLGRILMQSSRYGQAEHEFRAALAAQAGAGHPASDTVALITTHLASSLAHQGRYAVADTVARRASEILRQAPAGAALAAPEVLRTRAYIESRWRENFAAADSLLAAAVALLAARASDRSVEASDALEERAGNRLRLGDTPGADSLFREAVALRRRALGDEHPLVARAIENQSFFLYRTGRVDQTIEGLKRVLAIRQRGAGVESPPVGRTWLGLAPVYARARRHREAEHAFENGLRILRRRLGPNHPDLAPALADYADLRVQQGRFDDAEKLAREALAIRSASLGASSPGAVAARVTLAEVLRQKRAWSLYPEAEDLLLAARSAGIAARGPGDPGARRAAEALVRLYEAWGRAGEAARWRGLLAGGGAPRAAAP
uniref:Serine/threonine protein kinase n=1 Tax=Eiseniibacteriota bacterium TaxID=2212470 RepID=A0A832I117_UNCEI